MPPGIKSFIAAFPGPLAKATAVALLWLATCGLVNAAEPAVTPNRSLPKLDPPPGHLEFSASPSSEDFYRAHVFDDPLVPVNGEPSSAENAALSAALLEYSHRTSTDDFSSLTGFLKTHPRSSCRASLLLNLGLEYYRAAYYSRALEAWAQAWTLSQGATDLRGKALADRAAGELAYLYGRLGRMAELTPLLKSVENRAFSGPATERISSARAGLYQMQERPEISFRCGPLALQRIKLSVDPDHAGPATRAMYQSASTPQGFSLNQVARLSQEMGLNYQMAFRDKNASFVTPSVIHWKVGHFAAIIRQEGDRYLVQDPTFRNDVWASATTLENEASGYFLIPPDSLPEGWRDVDVVEGVAISGKGNVPGPDPNNGPGPGPPPRAPNPPDPPDPPAPPNHPNPPTPTSAPHTPNPPTT